MIVIYLGPFLVFYTLASLVVISGNLEVNRYLIPCYMVTCYRRVAYLTVLTLIASVQKGKSY